MSAKYLRAIGHWIRQRLWPSQSTGATALLSPVRTEPRNVLTLARWEAGGGPTPALHWVPCHPATAARFKATAVCNRGHVLTLKQHAVNAQGAVWPSVVCPALGCEFHRYIRLDGWSDGALD